MMNGRRGRRALVINTAFLGDVALTTPLYRLLAEAGWAVDALVVPRTAELPADSPDLERVIVYDKSNDRGLGALVRLAKSLRGSYDAVLTPHRSARSAILTHLIRAPLRVGYRPPRTPRPPGFSDPRLRPRFTPLGPLCFNRLVSYRLGIWEGRRTAELARGLNLEIPAETPGRLGVAPADAAWVAGELEESPRPRVVLFPGSVWDSKRYPVESWTEAAWRIMEERGAGVVVSGSPAEARAVAGVVDALPGARSLWGLDLGGLKALIAAADLVLCNDSAPLHLAVCLGTPVVAVYGPTDPRFGFRAPTRHPHRHVFLDDLNCRPCRLRPPRTCPLGHHDCMKKLEPRVISDAALRLLDEVER
ncbi:MAG: hypothetical protein GF403_04525 [Candidatus Coatesbacteria bacterium]|nr:hypothetical protein [Candidatus Coatesbacteria bacterium]